jgi:cell pole-organizing protein PopZ
MADARSEPSMEDILASIKRIIADDAPPPPQRLEAPSLVAPTPAQPLPQIAPPMHFPPATDQDDRSVLELTNPAPAPQPPRTSPTGERAADRFRQAVAPRVRPAASQPPFDIPAAPAQAAVPPSVAPPAPVASSQTVEALMRELLQPMIAQWVAANLPSITERVVREEIARLRDAED